MRAFEFYPIILLFFERKLKKNTLNMFLGFAKKPHMLNKFFISFLKWQPWVVEKNQLPQLNLHAQDLCLQPSVWLLVTTYEAHGREVLRPRPPT